MELLGSLPAHVQVRGDVGQAEKAGHGPEPSGGVVKGVKVG
jgi:hypothetical protein